MSQDIAHILEGWDFDPHELTVRIVQGEDGTKRIQMRIDLGLLQMNIDGRPDGKRPYDCESLLVYYQRQAEEYGDGYRLSNEAVDDLFRERWQYYHRYLCLFHLGHYDLVVRDTERSIVLFDFIRAHARRRRDKWRFDQYRPYVIMMNTRARATMRLQSNNRAGALEAIESGCRRIEAFLAHYERLNDENECFELEYLTRWQEELRASTSDSSAACSDPESMGTTNGLRMQLGKAISAEDYEHAAILRDQIRRLEQAESAE